MEEWGRSAGVKFGGLVDGRGDMVNWFGMDYVEDGGVEGGG